MNQYERHIRATKSEFRPYAPAVLHIFEIRDGKWFVPKPLEFVELPEQDGGFCPRGDDVIAMWPDQAQQLMDDLWTCGLRPSEGTGSSGALAATQKHLDDMREIAYAALKRLGVTS